MRPPLAPGTYGSSDLEPGDWLETNTVTVTGEMIDAFADLSGDRFEIHMNDTAARAHGFPARVAHGLLVLALVDGLKNQADATFRAIASLGWEWSFGAPVFIGDTLRVRIEVVSVRPTSKGDRGVLELAFIVQNQNGITVQSGTNKLLVYAGASASPT